MDELIDSKRQMTRSVSSLHNTAMSTTPNSDDLHENNLRSQYNNGGMSQSIRNLHKLSNPDLTLLDNYSTKNSSTTGDNSTTPEPAYYSTTLPKNLRKGAVQKRLERNNHLRVEQTTSGDSDNSEISPMSKKGTVFQRANQFRSISSVDNSLNPRAGSRLLTTVPQKTPNYLAQKLRSGYVFNVK